MKSTANNLYGKDFKDLTNFQKVQLYKNIYEADQNQAKRPSFLQSLSPSKMSFNPMTIGEVTLWDSNTISPEFKNLEKMHRKGHLSMHEKPAIEVMKQKQFIKHKPSSSVLQNHID